MLYMVELNFTQPARQSEWDAWYLHHLEVLLSLPGFHTAQRFRCMLPHPAPYLAVYSVDSPDVFESVPYRTRGGRDSTGEWKAMMTNWDRNVFAGVHRAPPVPQRAVLLMTDDPRAIPSQIGVAFRELTAAGLDRTVERRAIAVAAPTEVDGIVRAGNGAIRAYVPLMPQRVARGG